MTFESSRYTGLLPALLFAAAAGVFVVLGLSAIASHGWTEIYADQWRLYPIYLQEPFPANVLALENGHRPVFPGLVRVAEMHLFSGNQRLQLAVGALLALATFVILTGIAWRERGNDPLAASLAIALAAFAVFWLGNARMLLHGNESVHAYLLTASVAGGIALLSRPTPAWSSLWLAALLALVATFSFGPGLAAFVALTLLLVVQHRYRQAVGMVVALGLTLVLYFLLPGSDGVRNSLNLRPLDSLLTVATWLTSLPVTLFDAALDPDAGQSLPGWLHALLHPVAQGYRAGAGDIATQHGPATALGLLALAILAWATVGTWRQPARYGRLRLAGLALAWFGVGVAGIVALGRLDYFLDHPGQIFANRYLPWSCLFWLGWSWVLLGSPRAARRPARVALVACATVVLGMGLATTRGHLTWGELVRDGLRVDSAGIAVGHLDAHREMYGEGHVPHIVTALPVVRAAGLSMFAWPETRRLGERLAPMPPDARIGVGLVVARAVPNRLSPDPSLYLEVRLDAQALAPPHRLLVLDASGTARGILVRDGDGPAWRYRGYATGLASAAGLAVADAGLRFALPLRGLEAAPSAP